MKKLFHIALLSLMAGTAWALVPPRPQTATPEVWAKWDAMQQSMAAAAHAAPSRAAQSISASIMPPRIPVILVNFSNYALVSSRADIDSMFNGSHWAKDNAKGSVRQFFRDNSAGAYNPQFDIYGPVTLSQPYAYYGSGVGTSARPGYMVTEACALMDDSLDFSQYDSNSDDFVDLVFVLFAGFGENDAPTEDLVPNSSDLVWPHNWIINFAGCGSNTRVFDGKTVNEYECSNELDGLYSTLNHPVVSGIGVLVHEFCHGLGVPDMYTTNGATHKTLGCWSTLDVGCYNDDMHTPAALNAYERWLLGWLEPEQLGGAASDTLRPLATSNQAYYFTPDGSPVSNIKESGLTCYILENRYRTGWDNSTFRIQTYKGVEYPIQGLPGEGLLLYKIQNNTSGNTVNNNSGAMGVDILEADGWAPNKPNVRVYGKPEDCYPYIHGTDTLDSITIVSELPITRIRKEGANILFDVCGGAPTDSTATQLDNAWMRSEEKMLINGHLYIRRGEDVYMINGVRIGASQ